MLWFSVACFGVRVSVTFHLFFVNIILVRLGFAEWPPFGKELFTRFTICSLFISTICIFIFSRLGFEGGIKAVLNF